MSVQQQSVAVAIATVHTIISATRAVSIRPRDAS
jgi:hypothetical protein